MTENWTKKVLESTLKVYENERETLNEYEFELAWQLHRAALVPSEKHIGKIGKCLAELVMAQTEYVNSLKAEIADRLVALMPKSKKTSICKREMTAEELVEADKQAAIRASHSAGLIEQAKSASTERETLDALANFEANFHTKGHAVSKEWHDAMNFSKFESIAKILERSFLENKDFTVGDYLELSEQSKKSAKKIAA